MELNHNVFNMMINESLKFQEFLIYTGLLKELDIPGHIHLIILSKRLPGKKCAITTGCQMKKASISIYKVL